MAVSELNSNTLADALRACLVVDHGAQSDNVVTVAIDITNQLSRIADSLESIREAIRTFPVLRGE